MRTPTPPSRPGELPLLERLRASTKGRYTIHAELGTGGMATVFRATELALEREVAIKVMSSAAASSQGALERFRREARVAAALSHPHIVPIYAIGEDPALAYFAMKFIEGRGLDAILRKEGPQPIDVITKTITEVGRALHHAHEHGVVHRDVKPANIMVGNDGWIYVTDFGIAKQDDVKGLTQTGTVIGTPSYMSPEQFNGQEVTGAADQYSLGVVAYEMLAGRAPFDGPSLGEIMRGHLLEPPPPLRALRLDVPTALGDCVMRMLEKEPASRFPTLAVAVEAFEAAAARSAAGKGAAPRMVAVPPPAGHSSLAPTTPIPAPSTGAVTSGPRRRPATATQPRAIAKPRKGPSGFLVFLLLVTMLGGGWYQFGDQYGGPYLEKLEAVLAPLMARVRGPAVTDSTPARDTLATSVTAPESTVTVAESTSVTAAGPSGTTGATTTAGGAGPADSGSKAASRSSRGQIDSAIAAISAQLATAPVTDMVAPNDSSVVRVGSQTLQTVLFVNGQQVGLVGGQGLVGTTVAPGLVNISVRRLNCRDWDTTITALPGRRYTFRERSPIC